MALQYVTTSSIDLSGMKIDDNTAKKLAEGLQYNKSIMSMNLSNNNITDEGMQSLIEVLSSGNNTTLQELDIRKNKLTKLNYSPIRSNLKILTKPLEIPFPIDETLEKFNSTKDLSQVEDLMLILKKFLKSSSVKKDYQSQKSQIGVLQSKISEIMKAFKKKSDKLKDILEKLQQIKEQSSS